MLHADPVCESELNEQSTLTLITLGGGLIHWCLWIIGFLWTFAAMERIENLHLNIGGTCSFCVLWRQIQQINQLPTTITSFNPRSIPGTEASCDLNKNSRIAQLDRSSSRAYERCVCDGGDSVVRSTLERRGDRNHCQDDTKHLTLHRQGHLGQTAGNQSLGVLFFGSFDATQASNKVPKWPMAYSERART
jgi:hypothetical protein